MTTQSHDYPVTLSTRADADAMPKQTFFNLLQEKRDRIAELAVDEFSRFPYAQASISRIVERAGIAKGSFYQYFENKLDLYVWLTYKVIGDRKLAYFKAHPPPPGGDIFTQYEHLLFSGLKFGLENPRMSRVAQTIWQSTSDPNLKPMNQKMMKMTRQGLRIMLEQGIEAGHIREDIDLDIATDFFVAVTTHGLDLGLQRLVGVDLIEFCAQPELADRLPEEAQRKLIHGMVDLLRRGLGSGKPVEEGSDWAWDFEKIPRAIQEDEP